MLHAQRLIGVDRREIAELGAVTGLLRIKTVDGRNFGETGTLVAAARGTKRTLDHVARAQTRGADEVGGHEGVVIGLHVAVGMDDAGAVRANLQDALNIAEALGLRGCGVDLLDELGLLLAGRLNLELLGLLAQLGDLHGRELLARKRWLGRSCVALLVALFAVALTAAAVVVAIILALAALIVTLVLTAVGAGTLFGLSALDGRRRGRIGGRRGLAVRLSVGLGLLLSIPLLFGRLGLGRFLARALGLLACRPIGALRLGSRVDTRLGRLSYRRFGAGLRLCLSWAFGCGVTAAPGTNVGRLGSGRNSDLRNISTLGRNHGSRCRLDERRGILDRSRGSGRLLRLDKCLGLAAAAMRAQSRIDDKCTAGLGRHDRLSRGSVLLRRRANRGLGGIGRSLLGSLLDLGRRATARARSRLFCYLLGSRSRRRLGGGRSREFGQSRGIALGGTTASTNNLGFADLRKRAGLRNLI